MQFISWDWSYSFDSLKEKTVLYIHNISQFAPSTDSIWNVWHLHWLCVQHACGVCLCARANRSQYNLSSTYCVHIQRELQRKWRSTTTITAATNVQTHTHTHRTLNDIIKLINKFYHRLFANISPIDVALSYLATVCCILHLYDSFCSQVQCFLLPLSLFNSNDIIYWEYSNVTVVL